VNSEGAPSVMLWENEIGQDIQKSLRNQNEPISCYHIGIAYSIDINRICGFGLASSCCSWNHICFHYWLVILSALSSSSKY